MGRVYRGQPNSLLRAAEPMWGDADVLTNILTRLRPENSGNLLAAISTVHAKAKALQTIRNIRNGAAHNHAQNLSEIQLLQSAYVAFPIAHPTHSMFWIEPRSSDFLITDAIEDLKDETLAAIS